MSAPAVLTVKAHGPQPERLHDGQRFYRPELDVLRFGAFMAVFICHSLTGKIPAGAHGGLLAALSAFKDAGNFGVCVFFLLSAYLITELLLLERAKTRTVDVPFFYLRRILRIWPLYFGILLVYAVGGVHHPALHLEPGRTVAYLLLLGNWYIAFHPWISTPLRALWSISVEEQFYLLWPALARYGGVRGLKGCSLALIPLSIVAVALSSLSQWYLHVTVWLNSFVQFQFFALGALLAIGLRGQVLRTGKAVRLLSAFAGLSLWMLAAGVCRIKRPEPIHSVWAMCAGYELAAAGCVLLFLSVLGISNRHLPQWAVDLGKMSFGLYVFHETAFLFADDLERAVLHWLHPGSSVYGAWWALLLMANKCVALLFTVLLASASYQLWEKPFLKLKVRYTVIRSRAV